MSHGKHVPPGRMTRATFLTFLHTSRVPIAVDGPYDVQPCGCDDVNCHGWRLVPHVDDLAQDVGPRLFLADSDADRKGGRL